MVKDNTIMKVVELCAGYGDHMVLQNVSFDLKQGECLGIIGQNGSGKSTLLKALFGLIQMQNGNVFYKDKRLNGIVPHRMIKLGISYFLQGGLVMPELTVLDHLILSTMQGSKKNSLESILRDFPKIVPLLNQPAGNLSGGERQLLSCSMLLAQGTELWLLDEPTAGLSPDHVEFTRDFLFRKNREEGITMLIVEHNLEVATQLASQIVVARDGTLTQKFNEQEFLSKDFSNKYIYN